MADRQYELVYILPPDTTEQQVTELHEQIEAVVSRMNGQIEKTENWGRRRLAYEIGHHKEGVYVLEVINGSGELMKELDRRLRVMDQVIRHMVVRVDEEKKVVDRTRTKRQSESERRRVKRGLPPQRQPGEGRRRARPTIPTTIVLTGWRFNHAIRTRTLGRRRRRRRGRGGDKKTGDKEKGQRRPLFRRRKVCKFCADKIDDINYKDVKLIGPFVPGARQDSAAAHLGHLRDASAQAADGDQARAQIALIPYVTDEIAGWRRQSWKSFSESTSTTWGAAAKS